MDGSWNGGNRSLAQGKGSEFMKSENTIKTAIGLFLIIVLGSLLSAVLGGLFGILIATVSPEFTKSIHCHPIAGGNGV